MKAGRLEPGYPADYFTLNLDAPALNETDPYELLTAFVFGTDTTVIQNAAVAGAWINLSPDPSSLVASAGPP